MSQEPTPTDAPTEGQTPEGATGQEPTATTTSTPDAKADAKADGKTFDESYVKQLRSEAAGTRKELNAVKAELDAIRDKDKTEGERLTERVTESERRASAAETKLARYEVMAAHKIDLEYADLLAGETKDELEANATKLAQLLSDQRPKPLGGFDGGARQTPPETQTPERAHNDLLLQAMGRGQRQQ